MGQMIKIAYVGAFIAPQLQNFQEVKSTDEFYEEFNETGKFRTAYQGLENIDVLIPCGNEYAIKDQENEEEFVVDDFSALKELEEKLKSNYSETIEKLKATYPNGQFEVRSGFVSYWDEIA
jgi:hypothetical protein